MMSWQHSIVGSKLINSLNIKKTKAMAFHMPPKICQVPLLQIAGTNIEFVVNFNFLGITINKHLNWTSHVDILSAKMLKTIGILNAIKHVPTNIMTIYNCLILCHLNYGTLLWGSQLNVNDKLHKLQKKAARIITLNSYFTHYEPLFKQLFLLKSYGINIYIFYKCQVLKFIYKLVNNQLPHYFNQFTFTFKGIREAKMHFYRISDLLKNTFSVAVDLQNEFCIINACIIYQFLL